MALVEEGDEDAAVPHAEPFSRTMRRKGHPSTVPWKTARPSRDNSRLTALWKAVSWPLLLKDSLPSSSSALFLDRPAADLPPSNAVENKPLSTSSRRGCTRTSCPYGKVRPFGPQKLEVLDSSCISLVLLHRASQTKPSARAGWI